MTPLQSFNLNDRLVKSIAILDKARANVEYNSYLLWFDDYKTIRSELIAALDTVKHCEIDY